MLIPNTRKIFFFFQDDREMIVERELRFVDSLLNLIMISLNEESIVLVIDKNSL